MRTLFYSLGVLFVLGYATLRVYLHPSQVRARLEAEISQVLTRDAVLEGCEETFLGSLTLSRVLVPAEPGIAERTFLDLEDVRFEDGGPRRGFRRQRPPDGAGPRPALRVSKASLYLDHESPPSDRAGASRWNFESLFRLGAVQAHLESRHTRVLVDELQVQFQELHPPTEKLAWRFDAVDVEARSAQPADLILDAELREGEHWAGGHVEMSWSRSQGLHWKGRFEDLRGVEEWIPLCGEKARALWDAIRPEGSINVDVADFGQASGGGVSFRATVEHYDTRARLGDTGMEVRRVSGPMALTEAGIRFGKDAAGGVTRAEVLGLPVELEGFAEGEAAELKLKLSAMPLEAAGPGDGGPGARAVAAVLERLRPKGTIDGACSWSIRPGERESLGGSLRVGGLTTEGWGGLASFDGAFVFDSSAMRGAGAPARYTGKGRLVLDALSLVGLAPAHGEVRLDWDAKDLKLELSDVKIGGDGAGGVGGTSGTVIGSATWEWGKGIVGLEGRWIDIAVETGLLQAARVSGSFHSAAGGAGIDGGSGMMELTDVRMPAAVLAKEIGELRFTTGRCVLTQTGTPRWQVDVKSLQLVGDGRCLRARGTVTASGALDWIVLLSEGVVAAEVGRLPDASGPAAWRDAARGSYRAFRVSGSFMAPRSREVGPLDPAFTAVEERRQ